ncbi:hypothetical protein ACFLVF_01775 [Chloroflexota bacterium]
MEYVVEDKIRRIITRVLAAEGRIDILNDYERAELAAFLAERSTGEERATGLKINLEKGSPTS